MLFPQPLFCNPGTWRVRQALAGMLHLSSNGSVERDCRIQLWSYSLPGLHALWGVPHQGFHCLTATFLPVVYLPTPDPVPLWSSIDTLSDVWPDLRQWDFSPLWTLWRVRPISVLEDAETSRFFPLILQLRTLFPGWNSKDPARASLSTLSKYQRMRRWALPTAFFAFERSRIGR